MTSAPATLAQYHRPLPGGRYPDPPDLREDSLNLYTVPYTQLVEDLTDTLFPPNEVTTADGQSVRLVASEARVERYILFRAAWEPPFGAQVQLALRDLAQASMVRHGDHFSNLADADRTRLLQDMQGKALSPHEWPVPRDQAGQFGLLYLAIVEGLFGEPGYGGNHGGLGWHYSNFITLGA